MNECLLHSWKDDACDDDDDDDIERVGGLI